MLRSQLTRFLYGILPVAVLGVFMYSETPVRIWQNVAGRAAQQFLLVSLDPLTQWILFFGGVAYLTVLISISARQRGPETAFFRIGNADLWLLGAVIVCSLSYIQNYWNAIKPPNALGFVIGAAFGKAALLWSDRARNRQFRHAPEGWLMFSLLLLIVIAVFWQPQSNRIFDYRGTVRWTGPWQNPNQFGLLTSLGTVLAIGLFVLVWTQTRPANQPAWIRRVALFVLASCAMITGFGLAKSYSRGGALAFACSILYLAVSVLSIRSLSHRARKHLRQYGLGIALGIICIGMLAFWNFKDTDWRPARRVFSVGNANDLSWRNRLDAWEAALKMISERPLGFGWNSAESLYGPHYYQQGETAPTIYLNQYLSLGSSAGVSALLCFGVYIALVFASNRPQVRQDPALDDTAVRAPQHSIQPQTICRAGTAGLLAGFIFDWGLFHFSTGIPFWVMLELSRSNSGLESACKSSAPPFLKQLLASPRRRKCALTLASFILFTLAIPALQVAYVAIVNPSATLPSISAPKPVIQQWRPLSEISPVFLTAVWRSEDHRFLQHNGFDWYSVQDALNQARKTGKPPRGASTITQQCARTLFLWQKRSWIRKGLESYYTIWMELLLSKQRIFELYINWIELGDGIYGIEAAARHYYNVSAKDLTNEQAAMLTAIMPQPRLWNPLQPTERVAARQRAIIEQSYGWHFPLKAGTR